MTDIFFKCGLCGKHLVAHDARAGADVKCPDCANSTTIPNGVIVEHCSQCGQTVKASVEMKGERVDCSFCGSAVRLPSTFQEVHFPYNYKIKQHFPNNRHLAGLDGENVLLAERDGKFYIIGDQGSWAEFYEEGGADLNTLTIVRQFDTKEDRQDYLEKQNWWKALVSCQIPFNIDEHYQNQISEFAWGHFRNEGRGVVQARDIRERFLQDGGPIDLHYVTERDFVLQTTDDSELAKVLPRITSYDPWTYYLLLMQEGTASPQNCEVMEAPAQLPRDTSGIMLEEPGPGQAYAFFNCTASKETIENVLATIRQTAKTSVDLETSVNKNNSDIKARFPNLWEAARRKLVGMSYSLTGKYPHKFRDSPMIPASALDYLIIATSASMGGERTAKHLYSLLNSTHQSELYPPDAGWMDAVLYKVSSGAYYVVI
jgi:DNA-directed RNA polymerase subunit RPC12/RpoP